MSQQNARVAVVGIDLARSAAVRSELLTIRAICSETEHCQPDTNDPKRTSVSSADKTALLFARTALSSR